MYISTSVGQIKSVISLFKKYVLKKETRKLTWEDTKGKKNADDNR